MYVSYSKISNPILLNWKIIWMKKCLYCFKPIPSGIHGNSGSCSKLCKELRKKSREQENYKRKKNIADPVLELQNHLKALAEKFGY